MWKKCSDNNIKIVVSTSQLVFLVSLSFLKETTRWRKRYIDNGLHCLKKSIVSRSESQLSMGSCITFVQMGFQLEFLSWIQQIRREINIKVVFHAGCHKPKDKCFKVYSSNPSPGAVGWMCESKHDHQAQGDQRSFLTIVLLQIVSDSRSSATVKRALDGFCSSLEDFF